MGQYRSMTQTGKVGIEFDEFYCRILSGSRVLLGYLEVDEGCCVVRAVMIRVDQCNSLRRIYRIVYSQIMCTFVHPWYMPVVCTATTKK